MPMEVTWDVIMRLGDMISCIFARAYTLVPTVREKGVKLVIAFISHSYPESKSISEPLNLTLNTVLNQHGIVAAQAFIYDATNINKLNT